MASKKKERTKSEMRSLRTQQIISIAIGVIVILSMVISLLRF
ncbi:MAG TPA: hypothetical protein VF498_20330 [Anaerolineales bacterium]